MDGVIDGYGSSLAYWSGFGVQDVLFTFDKTILRRFPTHVGIVWTDVGWSFPRLGYGEVVFEAFDAMGNSLGTIGPVDVGDGRYLGETAEDRFFGAVCSRGISAFRISMPNIHPWINWEVDHLQYGVALDTCRFEPPIVNSDFQLKLGSTLPIKFHLLDSKGNVISELQDVTLEVSGPNASGQPVTYTFSSLNGSLSFDPTESPPHYIAIFSPLQGEVLAGGSYNVVVKEDGVSIGTISFIVDSGPRINRGNKAD
jgi:hypothetical protein